MTGHRLFKAGLRPAPMCLACEREKDDTLEHGPWGCMHPRVAERRKELIEKYGAKALDELPKCVRICGIIPDDQQLDEKFAEIALGETEEETRTERPPMPEESDEMSEDSEGFLMVAGDGACPGGQNDMRMVRSGSGLYYGKKHSHNKYWKTQGTAQNAQRAEVDAAWRWAAWSWSKQVYCTDSAQVCGSLNKIILGKNENEKNTKTFGNK